MVGALVASSSSPVVVCLVVPQGTHRPQALAAAFRQHHPEWIVGAIWCGDPQLRPGIGDVRWWDADVPVDEASLVANAPLVAEWARALQVVRTLLRDGARAVMIVWVGSIAVLERVDALVDPVSPLTLVPRFGDDVPIVDGLAPGAAWLVAAGAFHTEVAVFGQGSDDVLDALERGLVVQPVGPALDRVSMGFDVRACTDASIGAGPWRWPDGDVSMVIAAGYDTERPWVLRADSVDPMRIEVVGHAPRRAVMAAAEPQLCGRRTALILPGGVVVDEDVRQFAQAHQSLRAWSDAGVFRRELSKGHWQRRRAARDDLLRAFPDVPGRDGAAFLAWQRLAFVDDGVSLLIEPVVATDRGDGDGDGDGTVPVTATAVAETGGANVVGYLERAMSLGTIGRRMVACCDAAGIPTSTVAYGRTQSPMIPSSVSCDQVVRYDTSIVVVNGDQFDALLTDVPALRSSGRRIVGYWFWEVEAIPERMRRTMREVDEVWVATSFVCEALAAVDEAPVRLLPLGVPRPRSSGRARESFLPLRDSTDRFVFLTTIDHLSVTERKNPMASIAAFERAFAPGAGPLMLVKTMNAHHRRGQHERLLDAAAAHPDVRVWDATLDLADQMALVECADALVSLHRSEGLGLHLAEAMWLGTPTIATRYSGNLDLADDASAALIDAELVPIVGAEGVYPGTARWASPDIEQAASAMRRMVADRAWRTALREAASARMSAQPSPAHVGGAIGAALRELAASVAGGRRR